MKFFSRRRVFLCAGWYHMMHDGSPSRARSVHVKPLLFLARSGQINPDNQVYTFRLHKNIWFHNGKTMTSAGVLASFERYKRVGLDRSVLSPVAHWDVPDETTFVITLKEPFPTFLESMSSIAVPIAIIPAEHADAPAQQLPPVGTGPFPGGEICRRQPSAPSTFRGLCARYTPGRRC
jgi:ABC-type transport system substrate-binding protein